MIFGPAETHRHTYHLTRWAARRARRQWMRSRRGRDAYVHKLPAMSWRGRRWWVSYIDYTGPAAPQTEATRIA